jgi:hypothetical protein
MWDESTLLSFNFGNLPIFIQYSTKWIKAQRGCAKGDSESFLTEFFPKVLSNPLGGVARSEVFSGFWD